MPKTQIIDKIEQTPVTTTTTTTASTSATNTYVTTTLHMRPPPYQSNSNLSSYLDLYTKIADANGWNEAQRRNYLILCFPEGSAFQTVCLSATSSFDDLKAELKGIFTSHESHTRFSEYESRVFRDGEKVGEYERALRHLYQTVVGPNPEVDKQYLRKFISGLPIRWRGKINEHLYEDLAQALAHAQRLEAAEACQYAYPEPFVCTPSMHGAAAVALAAPTLLSPSTSSPTVANEVQELRQEVAELRLLLKDLLKSGQRSRHHRSSSSSSSDSRRSHRSRQRSHYSSRPKSSGPHRSKSSGPEICPFCKKEGHTLVDCYTRKNWTCKRCHQKGHSSRFCRKPSKSDERVAQKPKLTEN